MFLVAIGCMVVGRRFWLSGYVRDATGRLHLSRFWWAITMGLWGLASVVAAPAYQALEWHLKCTTADELYCRAYSWMEVVYIILHIAACNAMLLAVASSSQVSQLLFPNAFWLHTAGRTLSHQALPTCFG